MSKPVAEMKNTVEQFFADAFCAEKATFVPDKENFKIVGVIEITAKDNRGTFFVAHVEKI